MPIDVVSKTIMGAQVQNLSSPQNGEAFCGGPVLKGDGIERRLRHNRGVGVADGFVTGVRYDNVIPGEWVYGGYIYPHFGHFMSEVVHRVLPSRLLFPGRKFLFVGARSPHPISTMRQVPPTLQDILRLLEVDDSNSIVVNQHSMVECLHVVEQASNLGSDPKDGYLDVLSNYISDRIKAETAGSTLEIPRKIWVSRSNLPPGGVVLGERYLEEQLAACGVSILHPEDHTFAEQLRHYAEAESVVFHEGSACHGTELLGAQMMSQVGLVVRRPEVGKSFRAILQPRATSYSAFFDTKPLGSIVVSSDGQPLAYLGVAAAQPLLLGEFLREIFEVTLGDFTSADYLSRAREDLLRYCEYHRANNSSVGPGEVTQFQEDACRVMDGLAASLA